MDVLDVFITLNSGGNIYFLIKICFLIEKSKLFYLKNRLVNHKSDFSNLI
jgi:hypothetical protein